MTTISMNTGIDTPHLSIHKSIQLWILPTSNQSAFTQTTLPELTVKREGEGIKKDFVEQKYSETHLM